MTLSFLRRHSPKVGLASIAAIAGLEIAASPLSVWAQQAPATGQTLYSQGDPTDDEQYMLQLLNRARVNPAAEGQRLAAWLRDTPYGQAVVAQYGTNPDQVASDMAAFPPVPPVAFDPDLMAAARVHSNDYAAHGGYGPGGDFHVGYDGSTPQDRVEASGYTQAYAGENAFPGLDTPDEIHAGYFVDWGVPDFAHRVQCMEGNAINVVGMGVVPSPDGTLMDTEEYGNPKLMVDSHGRLANGDVPARLTGVVYNDANGNGQYDQGEGVAGATVSMVGGAYYAVTTASGGYSLPLVNADGSNADGTVQVYMAFADGGGYSATLAITEFAGYYGPYRGNIEWDATTADDLRSPDPNLPYFGGGPAATVGAGRAVKFKVFRPADSDLSQPYAISYKIKGSAVPGVNYVTLPATITVPAGESNAKVKVATLTGGSSATKLKLKLRGVSYRGTKTVTITP